MKKGILLLFVVPLGNHHILLQGNYENSLNEFLMANSCKRTE